MPQLKAVLSTLAITLPNLIRAAPTPNCLADPTCGPIPGESQMYSNYEGVEAPWPGNTTGAVLNTTAGPPGEDDLLFQNLLSAEWIIFSFYQQGVEAFNESAFTAAGYPNTTYSRIREIRNNEAGHLRIFQNRISSNSLKPGPCKYQFPFDDASSFLEVQNLIEVGSMAFLTGLELQAKSTLSRGALVAIAATETRHNTWGLITNWNADPFAGPADTFFPYANQILDYTGQWVVNGSCPSENPVYPSPRQGLPALDMKANTTQSMLPGTELELTISGGAHPATFEDDKDYYAVFFHGVLNISMPFDTKNYNTTVPSQLEAKGIYYVVIADTEGAPTEDSVLAGPMLLPVFMDSIGGGYQG